MAGRLVNSNRRLRIAAAAVVGLGLVAWAVWPKSTPAPGWAGDYDVTARTPDAISPGTVVDRSAPAGWSHLVIKSLPRVRPGEETKLPLLLRSEIVRNASWMFTVFAADVRPERHGRRTLYRLHAVGLGLGTNSAGRDVVITPETAAEHGVDLNWITREILTKGYRTQREAKVAVHGPTMAIVDTPVWYRAQTKHLLLRFRYALLVDAATGHLDVLVWLLDAAGGCGDGTAVLLAPDTIDEAELIPDPAEFIGIPSDAAFAVDRLPPHRARFLLPPALRTPAAQGKYELAEAAALEAGLRRLIEHHP
jgi:hypothetical protein